MDAEKMSRVIESFDWNILQKFYTDRDAFCKGCVQVEQRYCKYRKDEGCKHNAERRSGE